MKPGILLFQEQYMERIWGGTALWDILGKPLPEGKTIGEAWVIADHAACESLVSSGPLNGHSLRQLMLKHRPALLGNRAKPTAEGRFPLLLKLLDAAEVLSVQVHPDDAQAAQMGEQDGGKTEMWHVLDAVPGSELIAGLRPGTTREAFAQGLIEGEAASLMQHFAVASGDSVFVNAGCVHAIGGGILLAEIQQNSDITYRLFDWNRCDNAGNRRELHLDKGLAVMNFDDCAGGRVLPLRYTAGNAIRETLAACPFFAAEKVCLGALCEFEGNGESFHIVLALDTGITLGDDDNEYMLKRGEAALIPACVRRWHASGTGSFLDYYVPDLEKDIIDVLRLHGYSNQQIHMVNGLAEFSPKR